MLDARTVVILQHLIKIKASQAKSSPLHLKLNPIPYLST